MIIATYASKDSYAERLYDEVFLPSLAEHQPVDCVCHHRVGKAGLDGKELCFAKLCWLIDLLANANEPVFYTDVDVAILRPFVKRLLSGYRSSAIYFGNDGINGLCFGQFYMPRPHHAFLKELFTAVLNDGLAYEPGHHLDQEATNRYFELRGINKLDYMLGDEFYSVGRDPQRRGGAELGWMPKSVPVETLLVHATCVYPPDKEAVLREYTKLCV